MGTSWYEKVREFKSPIHVIAAFLLRSRDTQIAKVSQLSQQVAELQAQLEQQLQQQLQQARRKHQVPGASVAVWQSGTIVEAASGVLNLETKVKATTDSIFQVGSITKVFTATLVMQLQDEGLLDIDAPVKEYTPHPDINKTSVYSIKLLNVNNLKMLTIN